MGSDKIHETMKKIKQCLIMQYISVVQVRSRVFANLIEVGYTYTQTHIIHTNM